MSKDSSLFLLIALSMLYIPMTAIETFLRVDTMYFLLLTSTFYYLFKIIEDNNNKDFIKLLVILVLSVFVENQRFICCPYLYLFYFFQRVIKLSIYWVYRFPSY